MLREAPTECCLFAAQGLRSLGDTNSNKIWTLGSLPSSREGETYSEALVIPGRKW